MSNTWFVDLVNGVDTNTGASFAQRVKTLSKAATLAAAGDTVKVMGNAPTTSGTATWTNGSSLVTLSAALTKLIYADGAWTAGSANVTATANTTSPTPKQGTNAAKLATNASFTTGLVGYFPTGSVFNLSTYQQLSFWIYSTVALASGALSMKLCSDTAGATAVNTLAINQAINANQWTNITLNNAAALGSSIQSVALYANSTLASTSVLVDNVNACAAKSAAGCLTLGTLISPDNVSWYHVQSINGTSVYIDGQQSTAATLAKGYQGATASGVTFRMLQPTQVTTGNASTVYAQTFALNGTAALPVTISGGWDTTAMTTQSGWTTIDASDWVSSGVNLTGTTGYVTVDHFNFTRCAAPLGLVATAKGYAVSNGSLAGSGSFSAMPQHGMSITGENFLNASGTTAMVNIPLTANYQADGVAWSVVNSNFFGCTVDGIDVPKDIASPGVTITGCNASGNGGSGFNIQSPLAKFFNNTANNNASPGFNFANALDIVGYNLTARGNGTAQVQLNNATVEIFGLDTNTPGGSALPQISVVSGAMGQATVYNWTQYTGASPAAVLTSLGDPATGETAGNFVASQREGAVAANNSIYSDFGKITTTGVVGETGAGIGWNLAPNANAFAGSPLRLNVGKVACPANTTTYITYWAKVSAASGISGQLKVAGGRYPGVGSAGTDVVAAVSGTAWTQYTLSFTPTENCVVDVFFEVWGSASATMTVSGPVVISQ